MKLYEIVWNCNEIVWNCMKLYEIVMNLYEIVMKCMKLHEIVMKLYEIVWNCTKLYEIVMKLYEIVWMVGGLGDVWWFFVIAWLKNDLWIMIHHCGNDCYGRKPSMLRRSLNISMHQPMFGLLQSNLIGIKCIVYGT
jgi:hypothetical protein